MLVVEARAFHIQDNCFTSTLPSLSIMIEVLLICLAKYLRSLIVKDRNEINSESSAFHPCSSPLFPAFSYWVTHFYYILLFPELFVFEIKIMSICIIHKYIYSYFLNNILSQ